MGDLGKLVVTVARIGSLVMMISGYQGGGCLVGSTAVLGLRSNVLMLLAFYLMVASSMKVGITSKVRHPQLTAIKAWSVSHLLVNGDLPSIILFGGLLAWAVVGVILINRQDCKGALVATDTSWVKKRSPVL